MSGDLDLLLSQPLEEPADAGFSARVVARAEARETRGDALETIAMILTAAAIAAFLPLTNAGQEIARAGTELALSMPFAMGCALLVACWMAVRLLPE